jgi:uncharacterized coiled-coil protein SlyX
MSEDLAVLTDRIDALIEDRETASSKAFVAEMEHTLTDGYARALELEASRSRLERDVTDLATRIASADEADALRRMVESVASADRELAQLRTRLQMLRRRLDGVRTAAAAPYAPASEAVG